VRNAHCTCPLERALHSSRVKQGESMGEGHCTAVDPSAAFAWGRESRLTCKCSCRGWRGDSDLQVLLQRLRGGLEDLELRAALRGTYCGC